MKLALPIELALAAVFLGGVFVAQVPDGHFVVSAHEHVSLSAGPGGLFLVDPRIPGAPVPVAGLGADLTGLGIAGAGANCVAIRRQDGALLAGERGLITKAIHLHEILLAGTSAASDVKVFVGTVADPFGGGIHQVAVLPDGNALIAVGGLAATAPLNGALLGVVDFAAGTVSPLALPPGLGSHATALAVDRAGATAYAYVAPTEASPFGDLYAVPLASPASATKLASALQDVSGLAVDGKGRVLAAASFPSPAIHAVDPLTGSIAKLASPADVNGLGLEAATDQAVYVHNGATSPPGVYRLDAMGTSHLLTTGVTGVASGVDVRANPRTYGDGTAGLATYDWQVAPNPGGLPRVGSASFTLTVSSTSGSAAGVAYASFNPASFPFLGTTALIDPVGSFAAGNVPADGTVPVPIPADPALVGVATYFHSFHLDAGAPFGLASSPGLLAVVLD